MTRLGVFLLPLDGMLVHRRSLPDNLLVFPNNLPVPIYTSGWRGALWELSVLPKNTTQCPRPRLEPGTARSGDERTNHEATAPPQWVHSCVHQMFVEHEDQNVTWGDEERINWNSFLSDFSKIRRQHFFFFSNLTSQLFAYLTPCIRKRGRRRTTRGRSIQKDRDQYKLVRGQKTCEDRRRWTATMDTLPLPPHPPPNGSKRTH